MEQAFHDIMSDAIEITELFLIPFLIDLVQCHKILSAADNMTL